MPVNEAVVTGGLETNKNGLNQSSEEVVKEDIYFGDDYLFWDPAVWTMGNGDYQLPILNVFAEDKQPTTKVAHLPGETSGIILAAADDICVYPTVTTGKVSIANKVDGSEVSVYDLTGKLVMTSFDSELNISSLNAGIYLLSVDGQVVKIVKE